MWVIRTVAQGSIKRGHTSFLELLLSMVNREAWFPVLCETVHFKWLTRGNGLSVVPNM